MEWIFDPWPWYVAGPLIGLYVPLVYLVINRHFGVSSSLRDICATMAPKSIDYFRYNWKEYRWRLLFVGGIALGAFLSSTFLSNSDSVSLSAHTREVLSTLGIRDHSALVPLNLFSWSTLATVRGLVLIVIGGLLIGFGTRYADGCTSGHTIHGVANFHKSSIIASICFFAGGLFTTYVVLPFLLGS